MDFDKQIQQWARKTQNRFGEYQVGLVEEIATSLMAETPAESGRLKAAWHVTLNPSGDAPSGMKDPGGTNTIQKMIAQAEKLPVGTVFYIINNVVSEEGDQGGAGIHYAGVVNHSNPQVRYGKILVTPTTQQSYGFFWRATNNLTFYSDIAAVMAKRKIK